MIYFIECAGRVKIGFSEKPNLRLNKIAADAPFPCSLLGVIAGDQKTEADIQERWRHLRCHREWFAAGREFLAWISENTSQYRSEKQYKRYSEVCGFQVQRGVVGKIAKACGVTSPSVSQWKRIPAEHCLKVSEIIGVDAEVLRPDIFTLQLGGVQ